MKKESEKQLKGKTFGVFESALASFLFIVFNAIFLFVYGLLPKSMRQQTAVYYLASFLLEGMFGVTSVVVAMSQNISIFTETKMNKKINGKMILLGLAISLICLIGFGNVTTTFLSFLEILGYKSILSTTTIDTFGKYIIYVIISCLAPAFFEELLFRGVITSGLKERGQKVALFVSALIFTFMHGNAEQTIHQFIVGLVIGYIFLKSENLWLGIIVHFFNNFTSVTIMFVSNLLSSKNITNGIATDAVLSTSNQWVSLLGSLIMSLVFAYVAYLILKSLISSLLKENERVNGKKADNNLTEANAVATEVSSDESLKTSENANPESQNLEGNKDKFEGLSVATIVLFALSSAYLIYDWITALLQGFGII